MNENAGVAEYFEKTLKLEALKLKAVHDRIMPVDLMDHHGGIEGHIYRARAEIYGEEHSGNGIRDFFEQHFKDSENAWLNGYNPQHGFASRTLDLIANATSMAVCVHQSGIHSTNLTIDSVFGLGMTYDELISFYKVTFERLGFETSIDGDESSSMTEMTFTKDTFSEAEVKVYLSHSDGLTKSSRSTIVVQNPDELFPETERSSDFVENMHEVKNSGLYKS